MMSERKPPKKILIVLHGAIGDVVRALPLAVRIKKYWPETRLIWAIEPKSKDLLVDHPAVDELVVFERARGLAEFRRFLKIIRALNVDLTLDLQRHFKSGLVSFSSAAKTRVGFNRRNAKEFNWIFNNQSIPAAQAVTSKFEQYQQFGDQIGVPRTEQIDFGLSFSAETVRASEGLLRLACDERQVPLPPKNRRVALLIGGSWESKKWSATNFVQIAKRIVQELEALPIILGGPSDVRMSEIILRELGESECISLAGRTNLRQLAYLLSQVSTAVSGDSGPMHISAAVGTPVVSLWGPTSPSLTGPIGSEKYMIQTSIGCAQCYRRKCPGLDTLCMSDIPPEVVMHWLRDAAKS